MRTPITCQPRSVAAALATQKEQAVCDVIAYQGSQALIEHQAGLVLLGGCEASQEPVLQACIDIGLDSPARAPLLRWYDCNIYLSSMHNSKHNTQTTLACLHTRTCTHAHPQYFRMPSRAGAAMLWAQAQGPNMQSCQ